LGLYLIVRPRPAPIASLERDDELAALPIRSGARAVVVPERDAPPTVPRRSRAGRPRHVIGASMVAGLTILLAVWIVAPIAWIAIASTQPPSALIQVPPQLTTNISLGAYWSAITDPEWQGAAAVSVAVTVLATAIALVVALFAGYPLARFRMRGTRLLLLCLVATMLVPPIALAIPVLFVVIDLGIRDTILGLVLINAAFWSPILIWLVRSGFVGVPIELERAARIDGSSRLGTIVRVSLPAAAPVIAAATAIVFIGIWNDFVFAAVVGGRETHTLPRYLGESVSPLFDELAAKIVLTVAPCIALVALLRTRILKLG
jgi:ABC-type glycerol-3-phosphate transport system permease component